MNIKIRSTNFELTPAIEEYVNKKISLLGKFFTDDKLCEIELGKTSNAHKSGDIYRAEINIVGPIVDQVYAVTEEADLYAAIDILRDEAERMIVSRKEKKETVYRRGKARIKNLLKRLDFRK